MASTGFGTGRASQQEGHVQHQPASSGQSDECTHDQAKANRQLAEDDHVAEPAAAVGVHEELQEAAVPVERDDRCTGGGGSECTLPETRDALTGPIHPAGVLNLCQPATRKS